MFSLKVKGNESTKCPALWETCTPKVGKQAKQANIYVRIIFYTCILAEFSWTLMNYTRRHIMNEIVYQSNLLPICEVSSSGPALSHAPSATGVSHHLSLVKMNHLTCEWYSVCSMITLKLLKCMCEVWEHGKEHHPTSVWRLVERTGAADDTSKETPLFVLIWALFGATWLCVTSSFESQDMAKSGKGFLIYPALCKCSFFFLHKVKFCLNDQFVSIHLLHIHP